jgi:hypothetical protein
MWWMDSMLLAQSIERTGPMGPMLSLALATDPIGNGKHQKNLRRG